VHMVRLNVQLDYSAPQLATEHFNAVVYLLTYDPFQYSIPVLRYP
jgi:hypothetical protein